MTIGAGRVLLHYRLVEKLGEGGMGVVWKAVDTTLGREVAVKVLPEDVAGDRDRLSRFAREARAVAALNHPNIVTVHSVEEGEGVPFFTMELVEGETLEARIPGGGLPLERILELAIPVADALSTAHEKGITHRDLKPGNIMVTREGRVKILDFGLAKLCRPVDAAQLSRAPTQTGTQAGVVLGTPFYMSPEQISGKSLDHRSDVFSFGIVLYEMTTGRRPFSGSSAAEVAASILRDEAEPLDRIRAELPHELARIVRRCLEKEPERRYQSAKDLRNELQDLARDLEAGKVLRSAAASKHPEAPAARSLPRVVAIGAALAALLAASLLLLLNRGRHPRTGPTANETPMFQSLAVLPFDNLMKDPEQEYLVQGVQDALITDLSKIGTLRVISRTSAMRYKDTQKPVPEIAQELGVDALVEGSVLRSENRVRITAQLISGRTDQHLWAESYDRDLGNVLVQLNEVAESIARQINVVLTPELRRRLASAQRVSPEVEETYLKAAFLASRFGPQDARKALELFHRTIELDPTFAPGHAGAGAVEFLRGFTGTAPLDESMALAGAAARKALELDGRLAGAHSVLGWISLFYRWDWKGALAELQRALELDPNFPGARHGMADYLLVMGDVNGSVEQVRLAQQSDPLSQVTLAPVVAHLILARRDEEAIAEGERILKTDPDYAAVRYFFAVALWHKGFYERALEEWRKIPDNELSAIQRKAYDEGGPKATMRAAADYLARRPESANPLRIAGYYTAAGEGNLAFPWLEKAFQAHTPQLLHLKADPVFDPIRSDPRFTELLRRIGFPGTNR